MTRHKMIYAERLALTMRIKGREKWTTEEMLDLAELAGMLGAFSNAKTRGEEEAVAIKAAAALGVRILDLVRERL